MNTPQYPDVPVQLDLGDNVFGIIGTVAHALRQGGHRDAADAFAADAMNCASYDDVIQLAMRTVNVI
jgi:hypothetical protein